MTKVYLLNSYTTIKNIILNGGSSSLIVDYPMKILTYPFDLNQLNFDASIECHCDLRWDNGGGGGGEGPAHDTRTSEIRNNISRIIG